MAAGSDVVDWLHNYVTGFADRREARKYAAHMLRAGFIRHTVNKNTFSEQCYYVFGDLCSGECWVGREGGGGSVMFGNLCICSGECWVGRGGEGGGGERLVTGWYKG